MHKLFETLQITWLVWSIVLKYDSDFNFYFFSVCEKQNAKSLRHNDFFSFVFKNSSRFSLTQDTFLHFSSYTILYAPKYCILPYTKRTHSKPRLLYICSSRLFSTGRSLKANNRNSTNVDGIASHGLSAIFIFSDSERCFRCVCFSQLWGKNTWSHR